MTETTNFEISKKLAEIGFSRQAFWVWTSKDCCCPYETWLDGFRAYDLETLLDALPKNISEMGYVYPTGYHLNINLSQLSTISYIEDDLHSLRDNHPVFVEKRENESLADTAGRLLILLHEKNLIKF